MSLEEHIAQLAAAATDARLIRIKSELSVGKNEGQVQQIKQLLKTQRTEEQAPRVELMQGLGRSILKKVGKTDT